MAALNITNTPGQHPVLPKKAAGKLTTEARPMIIGIGGKAGAGKTTAAQKLRQLFGPKATIVPIGSIIKEELTRFLEDSGAGQYAARMYGTQAEKSALFDIDTAAATVACPQWPHYLQAHANLQNTPGRSVTSARILMQWYGTEYRRAQDKNYWLNLWRCQVNALLAKGIAVLVDDVRLPLEVDALLEFGGILIKIKRPGLNTSDAHATETALDSFTGWDDILVNDSTLEDYLKTVARFGMAVAIHRFAHPVAEEAP